MCACECVIKYYIFVYSTVFRLDYSDAPSSVVSRLTRNLIRSSSLLSEHSEEGELPAPVQQWLDQYSSWCNDWKIKSLDVLLARYYLYMYIAIQSIIFFNNLLICIYTGVCIRTYLDSITLILPPLYM